MTDIGMLTMRHARRLHRAAFTYVANVLDHEGNVIATARHRRPYYKSFRAWIRAEHRVNPLPYASAKLRRIVESAQ